MNDETCLPAPRPAADPVPRGRATRLLAALLVAAVVGTPSLAESPPAPDVDISGLEPLGATWREENPYRGDPRAQAAGSSAYAQACARCHGTEAIRPGPAADLRLVGLYCRRLSDPELERRCRQDADHYFGKTVQEGKTRLGVVHMPPWKDVLPQEAIWAIQVYVEGQRR